MRIFKFLHYQRYLGLSDLNYSSARKSYILQTSWSSFILGFLVQASLISCVLATLSKWSVNYQDTDSISGDTFDHLVILAAALTQLFANSWVRMHQQNILKLLQRLENVASGLNVKSLETQRIRWLYRLWVFTCIYYAVDVVIFALYDLDSKLEHYIFLLGFYVRLLCANFIITCYSALVYAIKHLFRIQRFQLQCYLLRCQLSPDKLAKSLHLNDELQSICQEEMVQVFGGALVLPYFYSMLDISEILYLALPKERFSYMEMVLLLRWMIPNSIYVSMPLLINDLDNEIIDITPGKWNRQSMYRFLIKRNERIDILPEVELN